MKFLKSIILVFLFSFKTFGIDSTTVTIKKNKIQFNLFAFKSLNKFPGSTFFYNISSSYEYKLKARYSVGININHSNDRFNKDYYIGIRNNYYLINNKKNELYLGSGIGFAKRKFWNGNLQKNAQIKFQVGYRFHIKQSFSGVFEVSNYRFGGAFPTLGFCYNFDSF